MVESSTQFSTRAEDQKNNGRHLVASNLFFRSAGYRIATYFDEADADRSNINLAIPDLLRAVYCARLAGNQSRAEEIAKISIAVGRIIQDTTEDEVWGSIIVEIIGDCQLLIGSQDATEYYRQAEAEYESFSEVEQISGALEPEFEEVQWVFEDFLESLDIDFMTESSPIDHVETDFKRRIEFKKSIVDEVVKKRL